MDQAFVFSFFELLDQFCQWCKFSLINKVELINEIYEMLEACVEMSFCTQEHNMLEVSMINMRINSKKSLENDFNDIHEVLRKWNS